MEYSTVKTIQKSERQSNIELYRIILMIFMVAHHYFVNSGLSVEVITNKTPLTFVYEVLGMWGKTGINCFVLITGYFMVQSHTTPIKFIKLFAEIEFYNILFYCIFLISGYTTFSIHGFVENIFPIKGIAQEFISCYLMFFLLIPFINILINNMNKIKYRYLLGVLLFSYVIIGSIPGFGTVMNYISWFTVIYIIGAYIRLYPEDFEKIRNGVFFAGSVTMSVISVVILTPIDKSYYFVSDSNKIFAVLVAVSMFLFFKDLNIRQSKVINTIAASTFGVLCIHANSGLMAQWLWTDTLKNVSAYHGGGVYGILHYIISVLLVYTVCTLFDMARIKWLEKPFMKKIRSMGYFDSWDKLFERLNFREVKINKK